MISLFCLVLFGIFCYALLDWIFFFFLIYQVGKWTRKKGIESMANHTFYDNYKAILMAMKNKELRITVPKNVSSLTNFSFLLTKKVGIQILI